MKVGILGTGDMGKPLVRRLLKENISVYIKKKIYDPDQRVTKSLKKAGAVVLDTIFEVGKAVDVIITELPKSPISPVLEEIILGEKGLLKSMSPGNIIIEAGNTSPTVTKKLAAACKEKDIGFLDAPMSGGPQGAASGNLTIFVGGDKSHLEKVMPILEKCGSIHHFGGPGAGQTAKLANNMIVAINLAGLSEALVFAKKMGVDIKLLFEGLCKGAANSWVLQNYGNDIIQRNIDKVDEENRHSSISDIDGRDRQLFWALDLGSKIDVPLPITMAAHELYKMARAAGKRGINESVTKYLEDLAGVKVEG